MYEADLKTTGKWFVYSALVGVVAGVGAIVFQFACQFVLHYGLAALTGYSPAEPSGEATWFSHSPSSDISLFAIVGVMAVGGLLSGLIVYYFAPEAEGHGTDSAIEAFHHKRGEIRSRIPIVKLISSAITLGTGGSGGREGPIAQIGAGFGSFLATKLKLSNHDRRILLAAGMGAGVGAIFRAPLAGALFSAEILYREQELESDVIVPTAISSVISYIVFSLSLPPEIQFTPLFGESIQFRMNSLLEILPLAALAVVLTLAGVLYIKTFYGTHRVFKKLPIPPWLSPVIGAVLAGAAGIAIYYASGADLASLAVLSTGYGFI
ncbi:MAG: chloride channel protein, partial [Planctomycetota bacterium]